MIIQLRPEKLRDLRDNELVKRGIKAVDLIFQLSNRVPSLIERSHLERREGQLHVHRKNIDRQLMVDNQLG